ncbi:MAG TPA: hypothetical protein VEH26_02445 [Chthoniobacterales bacterium]|nr:hypothetical protein [Chthoniobacterales bacterium]
MRNYIGKQSALVLSMFIAGGAFCYAGPVQIPMEKTVQPVTPVCDPRWYFSVGGSGEFDTDITDLQNSAVITAPGGQVLGQINSHDFDDAYGAAFYSIKAEVGRVITDRIELFGLFNFAASATENWIHHAGTINVGSVIPLSVKFDDYTSYGFQFGARYFFVPKEARLRPYASIAGGASHVESIGVESAVGQTTTVISRSHFFDDSWVGTVTGLGGVEYTLCCHWAIGVNAGLGYSSPLSQDDSDFQGPVSKVNNDVGDRVYCPVTIYAKVRF